jgi:hypothetical protein
MSRWPLRRSQPTGPRAARALTVSIAMPGRAQPEAMTAAVSADQCEMTYAEKTRGGLTLPTFDHADSRGVPQARVVLGSDRPVLTCGTRCFPGPEVGVLWRTVLSAGSKATTSPGRATEQATSAICRPMRCVQPR